MGNLPKDIEKEYRMYDLENKSGPTCGNSLHQIRMDEKMELVMIPTHTKQIIHQLSVYACRKCKKKERGTIVKAQGPAMLFTESPVSASLLSYLIDMKYNKGVPLYWIEQSLKMEGILFLRHTYVRWMIQASDQYLIKVYEYMHQKLQVETIINADETYHDLFTDGRKNSKLKRTLIIGRKNSMFLGSARGTQSSAVIYSLVQSAKENGLVPQRYLNYTLEKLPLNYEKEIEKLMPWNKEVQKTCKSEMQEQAGTNNIGSCLFFLYALC